jgi:hypothetical protein
MNNNPTKFYSCVDGSSTYTLIVGDNNGTLAGVYTETLPTTVAYCSHRGRRGCRTSSHPVSTTLKATRFLVYQQSESSGECSGWTEYESGSHETITRRETGWSNHRW